MANTHQLANGDGPGIVREAEVEYDQGNDGVHGAVENPPLNSKGEVGQREVLVRPEEDVRDETVIAALPFYK